MKIFWSDVARIDINNIYDYIAHDVPYYAVMFVDRIMNAVDKLQDNPRIGRKVPECGYQDNIRELIVHGYRIIYFVNDDIIRILTVVHGSRDLEKIFTKF